jgi:ribosomal protein S18 acetylase RimI-like enzyme
VIHVRLLRDADDEWKRETLLRAWGSSQVARRGVLIDATPLPGFVACDDDEPVGLLTYAVEGDELEVVTLHAERDGMGAGQALMRAARARAEELGLRRMWLITTNNNSRAFRFYQRFGMDLVAVIRDGVAASRQVKPSIPDYDADGVPIRHELEFELLFSASSP